jgi:ATP-dependent Lon protease
MNKIDSLDVALASRIPVLHFQGYTFKEKITIILNYLLPEILKEFNLTTDEIKIDVPTAEYLIKNVHEEDEDRASGKSGVRGLKKMLNKIISRVNIYKTVSIGGVLPFKLTFHIDNFNIPYSISKSLVDQIIRSTDEKANVTHSYYT